MLPTRTLMRTAALGLSLSLLLPLPGAQQEDAPAGPAAPPARGLDAEAAAAGLPEPSTATTALLADFDGDHRTDLFWYGPGAKPDHLWLGRPDRNFGGVPATVLGSYVPLVGDFNGNGRADVLWYGPGARRDRLWYGRAGGGFTRGSRVSVRGNYRPLLGDFNGDGRRDVLWYGPGHRRDVIWYGGAGGGFAPGRAPVVGSYQPLVGDFGGDGPDDVLWWAPGGRSDVLWFGRAGRRFTSRPTTLDLGYERALPLRRDMLRDHYNPYGFVAHAFGSVGGHSYSNTLEAFRRNHRRGFRAFEGDHVLLADGTVVLAHDGLEANYGLRKRFHQATWGDLAGRRYLGRYSVLRSKDALRLLRDHPLTFLILDLKYDGPKIFRTYVRQANAMGRPDLLKRVLPHVADQAELDAMRAYYPLRNYLLALYHTQGENRMDDAQAVAFVRRNRTPAVMMWWRRRDFSISLAANGLQRRRYRTGFARRLQAAGAVVYVHSLTSPTDITRFWRRGIGVYSDETFPRRDAPAQVDGPPPVLQTPEFGRRQDEASPPA